MINDSSFTLDEVIKALIGPIEPCGEHGVDEDRLKNLKALCSLHEKLGDAILDVAATPHQGQASIVAMVDYANIHLGEKCYRLFDEGYRLFNAANK